jgi:hypothetical protein
LPFEPKKEFATMAELQHVHLIEQDEATQILASPEMGSNADADADDDKSQHYGDGATVESPCYGHTLGHDFHEALDQFEKSSEFTRAVATALVAKESALVNNRLLSVQKKIYQRAASDIGAEERPVKRPRLDLRRQQESLWNRAVRTRRMNMLLQSFETTQQLLLDELMACADDADFCESRK